MESDYIQFVEDQIRNWKAVSKLSNPSGNVSPDLLDKALATYEETNLALIAEYERYKYRYEQEKEKFNIWFDEIFENARTTLNDPTLPAAKWASKSEIESHARVQNKGKFLEWKTKLNTMQAQVSFFRRVVDSWGRMDKILVTISSNLRSQLGALSTQSRANSQESPFPRRT